MKLLIRSQQHLKYYVVKYKLTELFSEGIVHIFSWLIDDETGFNVHRELWRGKVSEQQRTFVAMNSLMKKTTSPTAKNALEIFS